MGYTHYWSFNNPTEEKFQAAMLDCQKVIREYSKRYGGISGYNAHTEPGKYKGLFVNGSRDEKCEDFCIGKTVDELSPDFCKTRRFDYDNVVTACLFVLKYHLRTEFNMSSDGNLSEWEDGVTFACNTLGINSKEQNGLLCTTNKTMRE